MRPVISSQRDSPPFQDGRGTHYQPSFRPILCSLGLYQDPEATNIPAQRAGGKYK